MGIAPYVFALVASTSVAVAIAADSPATRPTVQPLAFGQAVPSTFVADGVILGNANGAVAFHVATDGHRQLCVVFDPADGTPAFISDGKQSLFYDLSNSRIVLMQAMSANVTFDWDAASPDGPLKVGVGEQPLDPQDPPPQCALHVEHWVASSANRLEQAGHTKRGLLFAAYRKERRCTESVEMNPADLSWYHFVSHSDRALFYNVDIQARWIGKDVPAAEVGFPDLTALKRTIAVVELDPKTVGEAEAARIMTTKLTIAMGKSAQDPVSGALGKPDWNALRARDKELGAKYRAALKQQGIQYSYNGHPAATQPGDTQR